MTFPLLDQYQQLATSLGATELAPYIYTLNAEPQDQLDIVVSAIIHGDEIVGLDVMLELLATLKKRPTSKKWGLSLGNIEAYKLEQRASERDLNRSFGTDSLETYEHKRAKELQELFKRAKVVIDLHQTIEPTKTPFFIFAYSEKTAKLCHHLRPEWPIVTYDPSVFSKDGLGSSAWLSQRNTPAMVVELGEKGHNPELQKIGMELIETVAAMDSLAFEVLPKNMWTWGQTVKKSSNDDELVRRFQNFEEVQVGEPLGNVGGVQASAEIDGPVLFPKYGKAKELSSELIRILKPFRPN